VHYNLLKQIPSGVGRGFSWGRHKMLPDFRDPPSQPSLDELDDPATLDLDDVSSADGVSSSQDPHDAGTASYEAFHGEFLFSVSPPMHART
jgi:hypothetical protein